MAGTGHSERCSPPFAIGAASSSRSGSGGLTHSTKVAGDLVGDRLGGNHRGEVTQSWELVHVGLCEVHGDVSHACSCLDGPIRKLRGQCDGGCARTSGMALAAWEAARRGERFDPKEWN